MCAGPHKVCVVLTKAAVTQVLPEADVPQLAGPHLGPPPAPRAVLSPSTSTAPHTDSTFSTSNGHPDTHTQHTDKQLMSRCIGFVLCVEKLFFGQYF